jgi:hypothetical protein
MCSGAKKKGASLNSTVSGNMATNYVSAVEAQSP